MKTATVAEMKAKFAAHLKASEQGPVVVTRSRKPVAVLLPVRDEAELERLVLAYSPQFRAIMDRSARQIRDGRSLSHEDFWKAVEAESASKVRVRSRRKTA